MHTRVTFTNFVTVEKRRVWSAVGLLLLCDGNVSVFILQNLGRIRREGLIQAV